MAGKDKANAAKGKGKAADKNKNNGKEDGDNGSKKGGKASGTGGSKILKPATAINVRHILCEKLSKKDEAVTKLRDGAKFDEIAREFSEDKARQGGSLGWKTRGSLDPAFEKLAYDLEPSTTANPKYGEVKTGFGYHVIMVEGRR
ncbi:MAG: Peptidyl-prolyl cis-trans isomerase pin4 [Chaenotheca gracillima]|nr:MAG: Peptidyl-prolyl cis-trans isomerase pin4 [Chaenotheca gracillima]